MKTLGELRKWLYEHRALSDDLGIKVSMNGMITEGEFKLKHYAATKYENALSDKFDRPAEIWIEDA